ncbi:hypothetical protein ACEWY4_003672 [Coilia grayii]|uniref:HAT C-terminal dimerisation domain-containing protein n=1 Tax=Coilia grayii TaxID=363190 RepID=A0ABD1KSI4_9TELE
MRPFDTVSGEGFHQVAQTLIDIGAKFGAVDATAILPHRQTVCDRAKAQASIDKEKLSEAIQRAISSNGGIAVTTDMWTDEFKKRAYTVLTSHYICDWELVNRILATVEFDHTLKKTSENLHEQITSVLSSYGILPDQAVFVTDQGSNIKAALRCYHWIPCSAHILNTVLRHTFGKKHAAVDGIEDVLDMIDYCKELVAYLKRTGATASLKHTVNQECDKHCEPKFGDVPYMRSLRSRASVLLDEKMRPTASHKIATFLHPKYKALKMLMEEEREEVLKQVRELLLAEGGTRVRQEEDESNPTTSTEQASGAKKSKTDVTEWEDDDTGPVDEVQDYSSTNFDLGSVDENLLSFWKAQGQTFPRLQHLAKRILSIPATSAASERSFSAAGRVIEARRSRLNPDTVDAILFLHSAKKKK